jgi:hypothetical protein
MSLDERLRGALQHSSSGVDPDLDENLLTVRRKTRRLAIRRRVSLVAFALAVVVGLVLAGPRVIGFLRSFPPAQPASPAPTAPPSPSTTRTDPLRGDWRQVATCQDIVRVMTLIGAANRLPALLQAEGGEATPPPKDRPCTGAPPEFVRILRFTDGHLLIFDPPHQEGSPANLLYTIVDDHTFTLVSAPGDHNIPGVYRFTYRIVGDQLAIEDLNHDVDTEETFEVAPFVRTG